MKKFLWLVILILFSGCTFHLTASEKVSGPIPKKSETKYGVITGKVSFGPLKPGPESLVEESQDVPAKIYETHKVAVFNEEGKKKIGEVPINKEGIYRIELPPGKYILRITPNSFGRFSNQPFKAEIVAGKTVQLDISVDTGMR
jgi:hypothetical protein